MTDFFALLEEPRRPWLEAEALKQKFLALSAVVHPDRAHRLGAAEQAAAQQRYTDLNAAYQCLREPKNRLRHLLELELGSLPQDVQPVPDHLTGFFMEVGSVCREADAVLAGKIESASPILQAGWFRRSQDQIGKLQAVQQKLKLHCEQLSGELRQLDREWENSGSRDFLLKQLEQLHRLFSYVGRWNQQLQERILRLSF